MNTQQHPKYGLRLLLGEMMITKALLAMSIMVPFYYSIGMNQTQIGMSQAACNAALLMLNLSTGRLADRFSRRWCNFGGDAAMALSLLAYSQAHSFTWVVGCEIVFGVGAAFSDGADNGLLQAFCFLLAGGDTDRKERLLVKYNSLVGMVQPGVQAVLVFVGGLIGGHSMRLAIALSAIPFLLGAACMLFMREVGVRDKDAHKNPLKDMWATVQFVWAHRQLRLTTYAYAVGREVTHLMVWGATPILVLAGAPVTVIAIAWSANGLLAVGGSALAGMFARRLPEWLRFALPVGVAVAALCVMSVHLSLATVWLYGVMGLVMGWTGAALTTMVQRHTPEAKSSSVMSVAKSGSQILYVPLVVIVGWFGRYDIRHTMPAIAIPFALMALVIVVRMRRSR